MLLRPYQQKVIDKGREALARIRKMNAVAGIKRNPRVLLQLPTGGGKTVVASFITHSHLSQLNRSVYFMCHRDFLVEQTSGTYGKLGIGHGFIAAKRWKNPFTNAYICMVQTVSARLDSIPAPTLCIWDECQHIGAKTWAKIQEAWPDTTHIGLSATPARMDGTGLDNFFDEMVLGPTVAELMEIGALADYKYYAPTTPDLSQFHKRAGEYRQDEVEAEMGKPKVIGNLVEHYAKLALKKKAIYFCPSIALSRDTAAAFCSAGFKFVHLDGTDTSWTRKRVARELAIGDIDGITNVDLVGEGYDLAAQAEMDVTVEVVGLGRPTLSLPLSKQQTGRVLRPKDYPGIILDHAGHLENFGLPDDPVEWSLQGVEKGPVMPNLECQGCGASLSAKYIICPHCGEQVREKKEAGAGSGEGGRKVEFVDGELGEIERTAYKREQKYKNLQEQQEAVTLDQLIQLARKRNVKNPEGWAAQIYTSRVAKGKGEQARMNL